MGAPVSGAARRLGLALGAGSDLLPHLLPPLAAPADPAGPPLPLIPDSLRLLGCGGGGGGGEAPGEPGWVGGGMAQGLTAAARPRGAGYWEARGGGGEEEEGEEEEEAAEPKLGHAWQTGDCLTIPMTVMYTFSSDLGQARAGPPAGAAHRGASGGARIAPLPGLVLRRAAGNNPLSCSVERSCREPDRRQAKQ